MVNRTRIGDPIPMPTRIGTHEAVSTVPILIGIDKERRAKNVEADAKANNQLHLWQ